MWVEDGVRGQWVKRPRRGLDGCLERYFNVIRVWVTKDKLQEGDTLSVKYGDTSGGSKGMRASIIRTGLQPILLSVDSSGGRRDETEIGRG